MFEEKLLISWDKESNPFYDEAENYAIKLSENQIVKNYTPLLLFC
jgi:hypothetical protein